MFSFSIQIYQMEQSPVSIGFILSVSYYVSDVCTLACVNLQVDNL